MRTLVIALLFSMGLSFSAIAQNTPGSILANRIAQRLKDTLVLSTAHQTQLYNLNMQLHEQKMEVRRQYTNTDSLHYYIQNIENTRDSLYRMIIPQEKYPIYLHNKGMLINNNY